MAVTELKNIHLASCYERLKTGKKIPFFGIFETFQKFHIGTDKHDFCSNQAKSKILPKNNNF